jgi:hypothetical protein
MDKTLSLLDTTPVWIEPLFGPLPTQLYLPHGRVQL